MSLNGVVTTNATTSSATTLSANRICPCDGDKSARRSGCSGDVACATNRTLRRNTARGSLIAFTRPTRQSVTEVQYGFMAYILSCHQPSPYRYDLSRGLILTQLHESDS